MAGDTTEVRMKLFVGSVGIDLTGPIFWVEKTIKRFVHMHKALIGEALVLPDDFEWGEQEKTNE